MSGIHDSGKRESFDTGAVRDIQEGKGRFDLISPEALFRLARWYELGSHKYGDRNWEKGIPISRCIGSAFRHLVKYMAGWTDEDHLAAVAWNVFAIMHFEKHMPELDDRAKQPGPEVEFKSSTNTCPYFARCIYTCEGNPETCSHIRFDDKGIHK